MSFDDGKVKIVIMAGGSGTRFWPISRMNRPKQFLSVSEDGVSLIAATVRRVIPLVGEKNIYVATNVAHTDLVRQHAPQVQIIEEPMQCNTAACIGLAALHVKRENPDGVMVVLPSDHAVGDEDNLRKSLAEAIELAQCKDYLVTIGILPESPNTAYGYIHRGQPIEGRMFRVAQFCEKPSSDRAREYVRSGEFYWNSGMFVWRADVLLQAIQRYMPELYAGLSEIEAALGSESEEKTVATVFEKLPRVSIDFGVMEHADNCAVVEAYDYGWNDVGSWDAWALHFEQDAHGNVLSSDAVVVDSSSCVVHSDEKDRLIGVLGCKDLVIIDSKDALLVCPRERVQDVRKIVDELKVRKRTDLV